MITLESLRADIESRLNDALSTKQHISIRWEPAHGVCRVGVCLHEYTWDNREAAIDVLLGFEDAYDGAIAVDFDVIPLESVNTSGFAEV